jgi:hypothetical protein
VLCFYFKQQVTDGKGLGVVFVKTLTYDVFFRHRVPRQKIRRRMAKGGIIASVKLWD